MLFIAELTNDSDFEKWLRVEVQKMRIVCDNLLSKYPSEEYPLFGNISPDVSPNWMLGYPFSINIQKLSPWQKLFKISILDPGNIETSKESKIEYVKLISSTWEVWINIKKNGVQCHGHNDNGQVVVFKKGNPVLVDIGLSRRTTKTEPDLGNQIDPEYHCNLRFENCPVEYNKSQGSVDFLATHAEIKSLSGNNLIFDIIYYSGKVITREIKIDKNEGVKIIDSLSIGNTAEKFRSTWHFAASEVKKTKISHLHTIEFKDCATVEVSNSNSNLEVVIENAFRSTSYGNIHPAKAMNIEGVISLNNKVQISIN